MGHELTSAEGGDPDESWTSCAAEALLVVEASPPMLRYGGGICDGAVVMTDVIDGDVVEADGGI